MTIPGRQRLDELLVDRAIHGLDDAHAEELDLLLGDAGGALDDAGFEAAVATLDLAWKDAGPSDAVATLPAHLRAQVESSGVAHVARVRRLSLLDVFDQERAVPPRRGGLSVWVLAAGLLMAVGLLLFSDRSGPTPVQLRAILADSTSTQQAVWQTLHEDASEASGVVLWDRSSQRGVMVFRGLVPNDPAVSQYQLWIFDRQQKVATPIDGGVFDISSAGGEAVVSIDAKLGVSEAFQFAITEEKPGGVVVSDREKLLLLAKFGE